MKEKCPACGDHQGVSDFDPDCGKFYTCQACGHRWSYAAGDEDDATDASCPLCTKPLGGELIVHSDCAKRENASDNDADDADLMEANW